MDFSVKVTLGADFKSKNLTLRANVNFFCFIHQYNISKQIFYIFRNRLDFIEGGNK